MNELIGSAAGGGGGGSLARLAFAATPTKSPRWEMMAAAATLDSTASSIGRRSES